MPRVLIVDDAAFMRKLLEKYSLLRRILISRVKLRTENRQWNCIRN